MKQAARTKAITSKYNSYSEPTRKFLQSVEKFIVKKYGGIEPHWDGQLQLLATNYELFILAKTQVREDGLMIRNRFGQWDKHPLLRQITDSNISFMSLDYHPPHWAKSKNLTMTMMRKMYCCNCLLNDH